MEDSKNDEVKNGYLRCLGKVVDRTQQLLRENDLSCHYDKIHAVKSILYAAIEQAEMETEKLISAQELLRELLMLVAVQADPVPAEKKEVLKVLEKLSAFDAA